MSKFPSLKRFSNNGLAVDCDDHIYICYSGIFGNSVRVFTPSDGKGIRRISCNRIKPQQISVIEPSKMIVSRTKNEDIRVLDQRCRVVHSVVKDIHTYRRFATVCKNGTILIAAINKEQDRVSIKQYTSELTYIKTLIIDHVIERLPRDCWCYLQEFSSGELALCTSARLYIFHKTVSPPGE